MILGVDLETCSGADLKAVGAWNYALHPSTRVHCAVLGLATAAGRYTMHRWTPGTPLPPRAVAHVRAGGPVLAHNATFEASIIEHVLAPQHGWPLPELDQWQDTVALAAACNLPASLDALSAVFGGAAKKDKAGADLMRSVMRATPADDGSWIYPELSPETLSRLLDYCEADVRAMLDCFFRLPPLGGVEEEVLRVDRKINTRGVYLDRKLAASMSKLVNARKDALGLVAFEASGFELADALGTPRVKAWLVEKGITLPTAVRVRKDGTREATPTVDRATVLKLLGAPDLDPDVQRVLGARAEASKATSLAKLHRVSQLVGPDGRMRHSLHYCAADTGRWASRGLQIHNMPKSKLGAMHAYTLACARAGDLDGLTLMFAHPLNALSWLLRSVIAAPPGRELIGGDWSAIEARVVAWLAGQDDLLDLFRTGQDVYVYAAEKVGSTDRQLGKVAVLGLGFGMGDVKFATTADNWGIRLSLRDAHRVRVAWRTANERIVAFWSELEDAVRTVILNRDKTVSVGEHVWVVGTPAAVCIYLPSGRCLYYWRPSIERTTRRFEVVDDNGELDVIEREIDEIRAFRAGPTGMERDSFYGGKLTENVTQAVARDLLAETLVRLDPTIYSVAVHVHDSIAAEVDLGAGDVDEFCSIMTTPPSWATDLPLKAEGYRSRYFKG